jgi:bifunctional UDP-N-acetylglucosamine pyrophosphorylase/glucosamine-1-phosphate N-acetyltransferase
VWLDCEVAIGEDTVVYPGVVIEGRTDIGSECVVGPHCRIIEASIGRGAELKGWNFIARTSIRNHAVLEPYVRRGFD